MFHWIISISMKHGHTLLLVSAMLLFSACAPHPGAGVWRAISDNSYGITVLTLSYDGKASFDTTKFQPASWRCFWGAVGEHEASLECSASTSPGQKEVFSLKLDDPDPIKQQRAELHHNEQLVAMFEREDKNPVIE